MKKSPQKKKTLIPLYLVAALAVIASWLLINNTEDLILAHILIIACVIYEHVFKAKK